MASRVWILGAGFSRSLGGPLLADVLSMRSWQQLRTKWPEQFQAISSPDQCAHYQVYALYHYGRGFPEGYALEPWPSEISPFRGEKFFRDAEDFLVQLDGPNSWTDLDNRDWYFRNLAARAEPAFAHVSPALRPFLSELRPREELVYQVRRIMAAECELFTDETSAQVAADWEPYRRWGSILTSDDAVISFNYDRVVELVCPRINVVGPRDSDANKPNLYKMHGSVTWGVNDEGQIVEAFDPPLLSLDGYKPAIGIPGQSKDAFAQGILSHVWGRARRELAQAKTVHIIGYSLPASDALPRSWILDRLRENPNKHLTINLILGEPGFHTSRLKDLFRHALSARYGQAYRNKELGASVPELRVEIPRLFAQDFLDAESLTDD